MEERKTFPLRMPVSLHRTLVAWAQTEKRSLHAHILWLLEQDAVRHLKAQQNSEIGKENA